MPHCGALLPFNIVPIFQYEVTLLLFYVFKQPSDIQQAPKREGKYATLCIRETGFGYSFSQQQQRQAMLAFASNKQCDTHVGQWAASTLSCAFLPSLSE